MSSFVNTGRGGLIDTQGSFAAIFLARLVLVAFDVYEARKSKRLRPWC